MKYLIALLALLMLLTPSALLAAQSVKAANPVAVVAACKGIEVKMKGSEGCATLLEKTLSADPAVLAELQATAETNDQGAAKALLLKAGLTERQLAEATIVLEHRVAGSSSRITITITCCPLTITIRF